MVTQQELNQQLQQQQSLLQQKQSEIQSQRSLSQISSISGLLARQRELEKLGQYSTTLGQIQSEINQPIEQVQDRGDFLRSIIEKGIKGKSVKQELLSLPRIERQIVENEINRIDKKIDKAKAYKDTDFVISKVEQQVGQSLSPQLRKQIASQVQKGATEIRIGDVPVKLNNITGQKSVSPNVIERLRQQSLDPAIFSQKLPSRAVYTYPTGLSSLTFDKSLPFREKSGQIAGTIDFFSSKLGGAVDRFSQGKSDSGKFYYTGQGVETFAGTGAEFLASPAIAAEELSTSAGRKRILKQSEDLSSTTGLPEGLITGGIVALDVLNVAPVAAISIKAISKELKAANVKGFSANELGLSKKEFESLETLKPENAGYYNIRTKALGNLQARFSQASPEIQDKAIKIFDKQFKRDLPESFLSTERESARVLKERFGALGGEGFTKVVPSTEISLGTERLAKKEIELIARDYLRFGIAKDIKEARKIARESSISRQKVSTYLPTQYETLGGTLGDIPQTIFLPEVKSRPDLLSRSFKQVGIGTTFTNERGTKIVRGVFGVGSRGKLIDRELQVISIPKKSKFGSISTFKPGRFSRRKAGAFIIERIEPIRKTSSGVIKVGEPTIRFLPIGKRQAKISEFPIELREFSRKSSQVAPIDVLKEIQIFRPRGKLKSEFGRGIPTSKSISEEFLLKGEARQKFFGRESGDLIYGNIEEVTPFTRVTKSRTSLLAPLKRMVIKNPIDDIFVRPPKSNTLRSGESLLLEQSVTQVPILSKPRINIPRARKISQLRQINEPYPIMVGGSGAKSIFAGTGKYEIQDVEFANPKSVVSGRFQQPILTRSLQREPQVNIIKLSSKNENQLKSLAKLDNVLNIYERQIPLIKSESRERLKTAMFQLQSSQQDLTPNFKPSFKQILQRPTTPEPEKPRKKIATPIFQLDDDSRVRRSFPASRPPRRGGAVALLKRRGKFQIVSGKTTPERALAIGKQKARQTLGVSVRVFEEGKGFLPLRAGEEFRYGKSGRDVFTLVQRRGARLSSRSEVAEIQASRRGRVRFL